MRGVKRPGDLQVSATLTDHWSEPGPLGVGRGFGEGGTGTFKCLLRGKKGRLLASLKAQNRLHGGGDLGSPSETWEVGSWEGWRYHGLSAHSLELCHSVGDIALEPAHRRGRVFHTFCSFLESRIQL